MDSDNSVQHENVPPAGDWLDAHGSQGHVNQATGPATQIFGPQRNVQTGGGDYAEGNIYKTSYGDVVPKPVDAATLAQAQAQLAALPLDTIPEPAPPPHGSHLPLGFTRNALFIGRNADLITLAQVLKGSTTVIGPTVVVSGMGGLGKTQLVNEFVHRYGQYFAGGVVWLSFEQPDSIPGQIAACHPTVSDPAVAFKLMLAEWQSPLPRLLVFDNCEEETLLQHWHPPGSGCRVLVTSRRSAWAPHLDVECLQLDVLSADESLALLRKHRPGLTPDDADLRAIADYLGHLPLALHIAGSFLDLYRNDFTPAAYLEALQRTPGVNHEFLVGEGISPTSHNQSIFGTFMLSYERLQPSNAIDVLALQLLARAAHFAPDVAIPRTLLRATVDTADAPEAKMQFTRALRRLTDLGLMEAEGDGTLRMHRLVGAFVRGGANDTQVQVAVERTMLATANEVNNLHDPRPLLALQPHLRAITDAAMGRTDEQVARLCNALGYHLQMVGDVAGATSYYEHALAICEQELGEDHPVMAETQNNLGYLLLAQGDLVGARPYYERALEIRKRVVGPDHPDTARSLNSLCALLRTKGDYQEARPYCEDALEIYKRKYGSNHVDTANTIWNLGALLLAQRNYGEAHSYLDEALKICERLLDPDHPDTARSLHSQGVLLQATGDLAGAKPYCERALAIRERVPGAHHPDTARSMNNLGWLLYQQGNLAGAKSILEQALAICEQRLGGDHMTTRTIRDNLAVLDAQASDTPSLIPTIERLLM